MIRRQAVAQNGVVAERDISALIPLARVLRIEVTSAERDEVRGRMPWASELCTSANVMHGGALMAFADTLGAVCASLNLPEGALTTTIESKKLRTFDRPVLLAWGAEDRFFPTRLAERLAGELPDAHLELIADARTFVPWDQPERLAELIDKFVS